MNTNGTSGKTIDCFRDSYFFLSNFYPCTFEYGGLTYGNAEAAFQAQKCMTEAEKRPFTALEPVKAKRLGRKVQLRPDWEEVKVEIMYAVVRAKFEQNGELRQRLLDTGDAYLAEGNTWNDTFWGVRASTGSGKNYLGQILMKLRDMFAFIDRLRFSLAWKSCIGNANDMLEGVRREPDPDRKPAAADSWNIGEEMPQYRVVMSVPFFVSAERMQCLRPGHIPEEMEDHWFMYCDEDSVHCVRSWNGIRYFSAKYRETELGYEFYELYAASEDTCGSHIPLFMYLIFSVCGAYAEADAMFDCYLQKEIEAAVAAGKYRCFFCED